MTVLFLAVVIDTLIIPPSVPQLALTTVTPRPVLTRAERERLVKKLQLYFSLQKSRPPAAQRPSRLRVRDTVGAPLRPVPNEGTITAGFYVNWQDNSWTSFNQHAEEMDWVVCEWAFVAPGGDSLLVAIDPRVLTRIAQLVREKRNAPQAFAMVSNFDSTTKVFETAWMRRLLTNPAARARAVAQLRELVVRQNLGGVTIDFEDVPPDLADEVALFAKALHAALSPIGRLTTQTIVVTLDPRVIRRYAAANDKLFLMLYDEHYGKGDAGPIASQRWYTRKAREMLALVPPEKVILAVGAYGYDWNDADTASSGTTLTFQDVMAAARESRARIQFDSASLNPYVMWSDPDSTDHVAWFLDGATAYNQILVGQSLGAAGHAIWRLGSEDPAIWKVLGRNGLHAPAQQLDSIPSGYDVEFRGNGEILDVRAKPTDGRRDITLDTTTGFVTGENVRIYPSPYIVRRFGVAYPHRVALTFDDGPDGRWTRPILDTLRKYGVPATFFVIGQNVEAHIPLTRRILREGHEIGNHTFTHPNMALMLNKRRQMELEIDANERLLEAVLGRRSAFFRPPYFGDAEPTTADELVPVGFARDRGYYTIGLHIDSEDWQQPGVDSIVRGTMTQRARGSVVLLHDGGGDRRQTLTALPMIIDSLRARGDTLVVVSELVGISRDAAMPDLPARSKVSRAVELVAYSLFGFFEWLAYWVFLVAVFLGLARLVFITGLALIQRVRSRRREGDYPTYTPSVSVIVPAYREEKVIVSTIASLVAQEYGGPLEILVIDDGSPDRTADVAREAFGQHSRVSIHRKDNGGKASALNFGLALATGEIVVCLDADTLFAPDTLRDLVAPLRDARVGAVAGNAKVGNRVNIVTRWQALEYVTSQNLDRRAFSLLNCITVVPGAVGAWRKDLVLEVGGFSEDTLAEDQDLTLEIRRRGYSIAYADRAIGYTEAPDTLRALARQRFRWSFGTLQCVYKNRDLLFRPRYGSLGFVALPNIWIFQLLFPAISPLADIMFVWSLISVYLVKAQHGTTYALTSLQQVVTLYALFLFADWSAAVAAFLMEPGEDRMLTWLIFIQRFAYRQVMYWVVVKSWVAAARGHVVGWGSLERKATVQLPGNGRGAAWHRRVLGRLGLLSEPTAE
ncbi:MAG: glycosyltransferase [Gemmatimonadota bacterium]|nr:glycosyltransferase [Gemmatimonadota bacterium]